jgi:multidrug efflux pump subunit AcrB
LDNLSLMALSITVSFVVDDEQDTGLTIGLSEAAQDISFWAMADRQQTLINAILRDPAVASVGSAVGAGGRSRPWRKMLIFRAIHFLHVVVITMHLAGDVSKPIC